MLPSSPRARAQRRPPTPRRVARRRPTTSSSCSCGGAGQSLGGPERRRSRRAARCAWATRSSRWVASSHLRAPRLRRARRDAAGGDRRPDGLATAGRAPTTARRVFNVEDAADSGRRRAQRGAARRAARGRDCARAALGRRLEAARQLREAGNAAFADATFAAALREYDFAVDLFREVANLARDQREAELGDTGRGLGSDDLRMRCVSPACSTCAASSASQRRRRRRRSRRRRRPGKPSDVDGRVARAYPTSSRWPHCAERVTSPRAAEASTAGVGEAHSRYFFETGRRRGRRRMGDLRIRGDLSSLTVRRGQAKARATDVDCRRIDPRPSPRPLRRPLLRRRQRVRQGALPARLHARQPCF